MALTTTAAGGVTVNHQLMRGFLLTAHQNCPFLAGTVPGKLEKRRGTRTVHWDRIENLPKVTTPQAELTGNLTLPIRTGVVPIITPLEATIAEYDQVIYMTEEVDLFSFNDHAAGYLNTLGINYGESLNGIMASIYDAETTDRFSGATATSTATVDSKLTPNDSRFVNNLLANNSGKRFTPKGLGNTRVGTAPVRAAYLGICHSDVEEDIRQMPGFKDVVTYASFAETFTGEFGSDSNGVRWVSTPNAPVAVDSGAAVGATGLRSSSGSNIDVYSSFVMAMNGTGSVGLGMNHTKEIYEAGDRLAAVEIIQKARGSSGIADPTNKVASMSWKTWFTGQVFNTVLTHWFTKIESGASTLT